MESKGLHPIVNLTNYILGMFLWVRLVMNGLENCTSEQELQDAVNTLPEGLDKACVT
jgi:hypothetical protein